MSKSCQLVWCSPVGYRWEREIRKRPMEALRYLPLMNLPGLVSVLVGDQVMVQRRDALLAVLALERYWRQHAEWPAALEELVPSLLAEVPRDRFDGERLRYRIVDGAPILYSVGVDRDDDAGRPFQGNPTNTNIFLQWWEAHLWAWSSKYYDGDWILWKRNPVR